MKYLDVPELRALYNVFAGREVGNTLLDGKLELFSLKSTQEDKKLKKEASRKAEAATQATGTRGTSPHSVSPKPDGVPHMSASASAAEATSSGAAAEPAGGGWRPISADDDEDDFEGRALSGDESVSESHGRPAGVSGAAAAAVTGGGSAAGGDDDDGYAPDPLYTLGRSRSESLAEGVVIPGGAGAAGLGAGFFSSGGGGGMPGGSLTGGGVPGMAAIVAWSAAGGPAGGLAGLAHSSSSGGGSLSTGPRAVPDRRAHLCMVATLNAIFPDYDFSATKPDAFVAHQPAALPAVQSQINSSLADLAAAEARNPLLPAEIEAATQVLVDSLPKQQGSGGRAGSAAAGSHAAAASSAAAAAGGAAGAAGAAGLGVGDKRGRSRSGSFSSVGTGALTAAAGAAGGRGGSAAISGSSAGAGAAAGAGKAGDAGSTGGGGGGGSGGKRLRRDSSVDEPAAAAAAAALLAGTPGAGGSGRPPRGHKGAASGASDAASVTTAGSSTHHQQPPHLLRSASDGGGGGGGESGAAELQSRAARLASLLGRMRGYGPRMAIPAGTGLVLAAPAPVPSGGAGSMALGVASSSSMGSMGMGGLGGAERLGSATFTFTDVLWEVLDALIDLPRCEVFSYAPRPAGGRDDDGDPLSEGALWSFNVFFLNRAKKRLAFLYVKARSRLAATSALAHLDPDASPAESPRRSQ